MIDRPLAGFDILLAEDDAVVAQAIGADLDNAGAKITGPVSTLEECYAASRARRLSAAVLDLNLHGELSFDFADELLRQKIPTVFITGYDPFIIPHRFADIAICPKPVSTKKLIESLVAAVQEQR